MVDNSYKILVLIIEVLSNKEVLNKNSSLYNSIMEVNYIERDIYFSINKKYKYFMFPYYQITLTETAENYYKNTKRSVKSIDKLIKKNINNPNSDLLSLDKKTLNDMIKHIILLKMVSVTEYVMTRATFEGRLNLTNFIFDESSLSRYASANEIVYGKICDLFDKTEDKEDLCYNVILFDALIENKIPFSKLSKEYIWNLPDDNLLKLDSVTNSDFKDCLSNKDKSLLTQLFADYDNNVINAGSAMFAVYSILVKSSLTTQDVEWAESELKSMKDNK